MARTGTDDTVERILLRRTPVRHRDPAERLTVAPAEEQHLDRRGGVAARSQERKAPPGARRDDAPYAESRALLQRLALEGPADFEHDFVVGFESRRRDGHFVAGRKRPRRERDVPDERFGPPETLRAGRRKQRAEQHA